MTDELENTPWIADARTLLDESARTIDAGTLSRLNQARHAALAQRRALLPRAGWFPLAGLAATCMVLLTFAVWNPHWRNGEPSVAPSQAIGEADAAVGDDIEFYQNLEFYAWLEAQDQDSDG